MGFITNINNNSNKENGKTIKIIYVPCSRNGCRCYLIWFYVLYINDDIIYIRNLVIKITTIILIEISSDSLERQAFKFNYKKMKTFFITDYSMFEIKDLRINIFLYELNIVSNLNDMHLILRRERNNKLYLYLSPQYQPESLKVKLDPKIESKLKRGTHTKVKIVFE